MVARRKKETLHRSVRSKARSAGTDQSVGQRTGQPCGAWQGPAAVAAGKTYTEAVRAASRKTGDAAARWLSEFNGQGLAALERGHGGGPALWAGPDSTWPTPSSASSCAVPWMARRPKRRNSSSTLWKPQPKPETANPHRSSGVANGPPAGQRSRQRSLQRRHALGGSGACTQRPVRQRTSSLKTWLKSNQTAH